MPKETLAKGTKVPNLIGKDQNGNPISLQDFAGSKIVLYFYPEDDTPGCTIESCNLRDNYALLTQKGIKVIGVSMDNEASHIAFIEKFSLPFPLIADTDQTWVNAYGAYGEKNLYGHKSMGIYRITYLINEDGTIFNVIKKVKTDNHSQQILDLWGI